MSDFRGSEVSADILLINIKFDYDYDRYLRYVEAIIGNRKHLQRWVCSKRSTR